MRYLVLSDIHANMPALEAVLADAAAEGYDRALVLGDLVGYGADPAAVIARTLELQPAAMIRGNHDKAVAGLQSADGFSPDARVAAEWTAAVLRKSDVEALAALPQGPCDVADGVAICHGAPFDEDYYIFTAGDARRAMRHTPARVICFGHTHVPAVFATSDIVAVPSEGSDMRLPSRGQLLLNVGSVGQPRDGDPRAAYGILDMAAERVRLRRVLYDVGRAQARIREAGLPDWLAERLALGR